MRYVNYMFVVVIGQWTLIYFASNNSCKHTLIFADLLLRHVTKDGELFMSYVMIIIWCD